MSYPNELKTGNGKHMDQAVPCAIPPLSVCTSVWHQQKQQTKKLFRPPFHPFSTDSQNNSETESKMDCK